MRRRAWKSVVFEIDPVSRYLSWLGNQISTSYVFADALDMSPAGSTTTRYGRSSSVTSSSVFESRSSSSSHELSGRVRRTARPC